MHLSKHKQIRLQKTAANEFELTPLINESTVQKPVRRIYRCPTNIKWSVDEDSEQMKEFGETSGQPRFSDNIIQKKMKESYDNSRLGESLPRFGPLYGVDLPSIKAIKEKAWEHVLNNSTEKDPMVIKEIYLQAIRKVEQEVKEIYADKISGTMSDIRWMMIKDGCFFLQLALLILGCSNELVCPSINLIFDQKHKKRDSKRCTEAMFFVGNQIPLVVLTELMNQNFFQDVIAREKWDPPPPGLCNKVLYELLVLPTLIARGKWYPPPGLCKKVLYELLVLPVLKRNLKERIMGRGHNSVDRQPSDLLHGLQNLLIGSGSLGHELSTEYDADDDIDLEANVEDIGERIFTNAAESGDGTATSDNVDRIRVLLNAIGFSNDRKRVFPCATELKRAGISIQKLKGRGNESIDFKSYYFWAYLYLPVFPVDENTEMILKNLKTYEIINQQLGKQKRDASSYLRFMSDIIQTMKDVKLLMKKGIIRGKLDDAEKLPGILSRLSSDDMRLTHAFRTLRRKIRDYSSPWIHYKGVVNLVVLLTLIQAFFAMLAYFKPPKNY